MASLLVDILASGVRDKTGEPLDSGKVWFYEPGTTTPVNVYQDSALTLIHPNPLTLGTDGKSEAYVTEDVRIVIEAADGTAIDDLDSLGGIGQVSGDTTIGSGPNDIITINGQIKGDLIPAVDSTYDIGSSSKNWQELHVNEAFIKGDLDVVGDTTLNGDLTVENNVTINGTGPHSVTQEFADEVVGSSSFSLGAEYDLSGANTTSTFTSGTFTTLAGCTATVTVALNESVLIMLVPDSTYDAASLSNIQPQESGANPDIHIRFRLQRNGVNASRIIRLGADQLVQPGTASMHFSPSSVSFFDPTPGAGSHNYTIQVAEFGSQAIIGNVRILAIVLKEQ